jgi:DNA polymerase III epsilon subunit-like protein
MNKKPVKILHIDTETTGLDPIRQDVIQIAGIVEIGGAVVEEFNLFCQPFSYDNISPEALEVNGRTIDEIKTFPSPHDTWAALTRIMGKYVDKYDKADKYTPAGYNVRFDLDFMSQWFQKNGDKYFGSWQNWRALDPLPFLHAMDHAGMISLQNYKLETVANHLGIEIDAHDALSDVRATRQVLKHILGTFGMFQRAA